jgi:hypothetical protein
MTPLRTIALTTAVALPLGVLISQVVPVPRWTPVECNSFADDLMRSSDLLRQSGDPIAPNELHEELVKRGITLPSPPSLTFAPRYSGRGGAEALLRDYESAKKAYETKWEDIKSSPEYQRAREAILSRHRDERLRACLRFRAIQEKGMFR